MLEMINKKTAIPPIPAEKVKEIVLGKRIACMSIEQIENVFNLIEEERNAEGIYNTLKRRSV